MFFKILLNYAIGYVNIRIEGYCAEKLINKCVNNKILFWNIKREKSTIIYAKVCVRDFKKLCRIAKDTKCKVKILSKKGIPFLLNKYRKRKMFLILIIVILVILFALSRFIWNIDIEGIDKISKEDIMEMLSENGLEIGKLKSSIDKQKIINAIRLQRGDVAWIGISIEGTKATVEIVEAEAQPEIVNEEDYCNIVANKDGQIVKISAQNGISVVNIGDIVTKGDILIAGWIEGKYTGTRYLHAEGEVIAKVWYSEKEKVPLNQVVESFTGNIENKYKIKFNNFTINFYKTLSKFEIYDTIETYNQIQIFSNFYLPIELIKITNSEKTENQITYGTEEATQIGIQKASQRLDKTIENPENILQKYQNVYACEEYVEVEVIYEVLENIGTKEEIVF